MLVIHFLFPIFATDKVYQNIYSNVQKQGHSKATINNQSKKDILKKKNEEFHHHQTRRL